ncbi:hypothetical protein O7543_14680 [Solwaraspora sp. WMMA2080]|uniref:hypothetical protein n=1 Tax=unclassified Solwaraspora TaxID=2627926 RepID=UPI00248D1A93|nr:MULTISPECIES: hypothetical protein [unclassified Solwaraspora]WBB97889.1 hypothetical protein O7553_02670 [Solwaraspora sp. WMMA2059]WBC23552.1 hypothetical protein O7543_14680 [Solwaraspora sp. WMMA2080]
MADLFEDYHLGPGWDEMFGEPGMPRQTYEALHATLQPLSSAELEVRADVLARAFLDQGITFALSGYARWRRSSPTSTVRPGCLPTAWYPAGWW